MYRVVMAALGLILLASLQVVGAPAARADGMASFYGYDFAGKPTANGETFNPQAMTAASRTLPFGTMVRVTNRNTGRSVVVRINDRGPFVGGRVIDLSQGAAGVIGMINSGVAPVDIAVIGSAGRTQVAVNVPRRHRAVQVAARSVKHRHAAVQVARIKVKSSKTVVASLGHHHRHHAASYQVASVKHKHHTSSIAHSAAPDVASQDFSGESY
jgi:rare lipoprotein A